MKRTASVPVWNAYKIAPQVPTVKALAVASAAARGAISTAPAVVASLYGF